MAIDRRRFLKAGAAQAALLGTGALAGCAAHPGAGTVEPGTDPFRHGVASGDPLADRVILWTRVSPTTLDPDTPIRTRWWIARDADGRDVVAEGEVDATPERDFTVKVDATGLSPARDYHYGFVAGSFGAAAGSFGSAAGAFGSAAGAARSPVGRTRTLPEGDVERVRLAFASCSNYPAGFFNAYACMAERDDLDAVLHLGDYLYEYANGEYGDGTAIGRIPEPDHETITLEDYRLRHATYKGDPDLQAAHARHPWITVWDDHESANNSSRDGAENHDPEAEGDWTTRKLAAIRAYQEWMPIRELPTGLFRRFRFGTLVDLVMLDTRLHGRDPEGPRTRASAEDPSRSLLGLDQMGWLRATLRDSRRRAMRWRVIGQQVIVSPVSHDGVDFNPDSWSGYRADRRRLLDGLVADGIEDVVFLTGDVHSSWVFDVPPPERSGEAYDPETGAGSRAVEFVTPAVSSPPIGRHPRVRELYADIRATNPHLVYVNLDDQGFAILDVDRERARVEYVYTEPAERRSSRARPGPVFETRAGASHAVRVDDGA